MASRFSRSGSEHAVPKPTRWHVKAASDATPSTQDERSPSTQSEATPSTQDERSVSPIADVVRGPPGHHGRSRWNKLSAPQAPRSDGDTDETRETETEVESLGEDGGRSLDAKDFGARGSPCNSDIEHTQGKAVNSADIAPPPGLGLGSKGAAPASALPKAAVPAPALVLGATPRQAELPPAAPREAAPAGAAPSSWLPMKIDAQHVAGNPTEVRNPTLPIKKRPLWPEQPALGLDPSEPVFQTIPKILFQDCPALCTEEPSALSPDRSSMPVPASEAAGQADWWQGMAAMVQQGTAGVHLPAPGVEAVLDGRTTVMLRGLPDNFTREMLLETMNSMGFYGLYDFVYLPIAFASGTSLGYGIVNLVSPADIPTFWERFAGLQDWAVLWSPQQGLAELVERYRNSPVMHPTVPDECKPALFHGGVRVAFAAPTEKVKPPRLRGPANRIRAKIEREPGASQVLRL